VTTANEPVEIPGFADLRLLGQGGFSTVYRARQVRLDRDIAVKVLHVHPSDEQARSRFLDECAAAGRLADHPNIVTVYDSGFTPTGEPYLVMELCQGTLAERLRNGPLDVRSGLTILVKLAGALGTAHRAGVLHRDIKPENVLFTGYGEPALADFGLATLTSGGPRSYTVAALTPNHAAPEVLDGGRASVPSDVYGLASTGYQILSGAPPFQRGRDEGLLSFFGRMVREPAPRLAVMDPPAGLVDAVARGLAKAPGDRYPSAEEFGLALRAVQARAGYPQTEMTIGSANAPVSVPAAPLDPTVVADPEPVAPPVAAAPQVPSPAPAAPLPAPLPLPVAADEDVVVPPPPPPVPAPAAGTGSGEGNLTMVRAGGPAASPVPVPAPPSSARSRPRWLVPVLIAAAVLLVLCGTGVVLGWSALRGRGANPVVVDQTTPATTPPSRSAAASPTPPTTPRASTTAPASSSSGATAPGNTTPSGPRVDTLRVSQAPVCKSTGPGGTFGGTIELQWTVAGGATGSELYVDGGLYSTYGTNVTESLNFACDGNPGEVVTHTYLVKTTGGGAQKSKSVSASATIPH
jgi:hypothetical protein